MRSIEARMRSEIERALAVVLDGRALEITDAKSHDCIAQLRTSAWAPAYEQAAITKLADQEEAWLAPPVRRLCG